jgi:hypothetical protein
MYALGIGIAVIGAVLLIATNVVHMRQYGRFLKHLEKHHPEHWTSIGSPVQFEDEPQFGSIGYAQYFSGRRYADLGDAELSNLGDQVRGKRKWMFVCLAILVLGVSAATGEIG